MELFGIILVVLVVVSYLARPEINAIIMLCLSMFVATSALTIGGLTINPAIVYVPIFVWRTLTTENKHKDQSKRLLSKAGLLLFLFVIYGLCISILGPRIFAGDINVVWPTISGQGPSYQPLAPGGGNFTQSIYAIMAFACFLSSVALFHKVGDGASLIITAGVYAAGISALFSALDIATGITGTSYLLQFIRNGGYSILDTAQINGIKRVCGTSTEASHHAIYCLSLFAFLFSLFTQRVRPFVTGWLSVITLLSLLMALSTTGFVGIAIYVFRLLGSWVVSFAQVDQRKRGSSFVGMSILLLLVLLGFVLYFFEGSYTILTEMVLNKGQSQSGIERGLWNQTAWEAFLASYGVGIGFGSTFASSFPLVLLSNTGILGTVLYASFIITSLKLPKSVEIPSMTNSAILACREGVIGYLIGASLSSTVFDLGLHIYVLLGAANGLILGLQNSRLKKKPTSL